MAKLQLLLLLVCMAIGESRFHSLSTPKPNPKLQDFGLTSLDTDQNRLGPVADEIHLLRDRYYWGDDWNTLYQFANFCKSVKWSNNGRCGPSYGNNVCNHKAVKWQMWCSNGGWCGNTQDHKNSGLANFHFPEQCKQLIKWGIPY